MPKRAQQTMQTMQTPDNKRKFVQHVASRKAVPISMEVKESDIEIPPEYSDAKLQLNKAKATGLCSLQEATITACDMDGDRQWVRLSFDNDFKDEAFLTWFQDLAQQLIDTLGVEALPRSEPRTTLLLSRFRRDYSGKEKVPPRLWKMDREGTLQPYEGCLSEGMVVICSCAELRAYEKNGVNVVGELHRDIIVVRKSTRKRRKIVYFSDSD